MGRRESPHDRWFFYDEITGKYTKTIDHPTLHPGFQGWRSGYNRDGCVITEHPVVLWAGRMLEGRAMRATQKDSVICSTSCRKAIQPSCVCSCGGKNHGIDHTETVSVYERAESVA